MGQRVRKRVLTWAELVRFLLKVFGLFIKDVTMPSVVKQISVTVFIRVRLFFLIILMNIVFNEATSLRMEEL